MDAVTVVPAPTNEPVHDYAPGSPERARLQAKLAELAANPTDIQQVIGGVHRTASGAGRERRPAAPARLGDRLATPTPPTPTSPTPSRPPPRPPRPGATCPSTSGPRSSCAPPTCCAGPWRETHRRRHHARPVQDRLPGRDRHPVRADRLLALQRRTSPGRSSPTSRSRRPGSGTGSTTARSRASSTRSPRSTSPPSPATCRPRRR